MRKLISSRECSPESRFLRMRSTARMRHWRLRRERNIGGWWRQRSAIRSAIRILTAIQGRALDTFAGWLSKASRKVVGHESDAVGLRRQREIHHDGGVDFDGFSVQESGSVAPLAHGFDGGAGEIGIDLAVHDAEGERLALHADYGVEDHSAA